MDMRKLTRNHYRLLRSAKVDTKRKIRRSELDKLGWVLPELWGKYASSSFIIKTLRDNDPLRLNEHLKNNSKNKPGFQCIGNRLKDVFEEIVLPFDLTESNDVIHVRLKKCLGFTMREPQGPHLNTNAKDLGVPEPGVQEISSEEEIYLQME